MQVRTQRAPSRRAGASAPAHGPAGASAAPQHSRAERPPGDLCGTLLVCAVCAACAGAPAPGGAPADASPGAHPPDAEPVVAADVLQDVPSAGRPAHDAVAVPDARPGDGGPRDASPLVDGRACAARCLGQRPPICCGDVGFDSPCHASCAGWTIARIQRDCTVGPCTSCACTDPRQDDPCGGRGVCDRGGNYHAEWCRFACGRPLQDVLDDVAHCGPCKVPSACPACPPMPPSVAVCGADGTTYGSACELGCYRVPLACAGACVDLDALPPPCSACPLTCAPVCTWSEAGLRTARNACLATCTGATIVHTGACCAVPDAWVPVCSTEGVTYPNALVAACGDAEVAYLGTCVCDCDMTVVDPVCGATGHTYANGCAAACAGEASVSDGPCP